jgi:hypothetical protein
VAAAPALDAELRLIARAREALARDAAQALAITAEHGSAFPAGRLAEERELIAIAALVRLGRQADAAVRVRAFRDAHPASAHLRRIDSMLGRAIESKE